MNDEKTAVIKMVSDGTIAASEGLVLFEALCDLEGMGSYESVFKGRAFYTPNHHGGESFSGHPFRPPGHGGLGWQYH